MFKGFETLNMYFIDGCLCQQRGGADHSTIILRQILGTRPGVQIRFLHWRDNWSNFTKIFNLTSLGYNFFCKHKSILESTQVVKFSIPTMFKKQLLKIYYKYIIALASASGAVTTQPQSAQLSYYHSTVR